MDTPLTPGWWEWQGEDPDAASCAVFLADVEAGCEFGADRRSCPELEALEARVRQDQRFPGLLASFQNFWREGMLGLEIGASPGCGQGLFVADTE